MLNHLERADHHRLENTFQTLLLVGGMLLLLAFLGHLLGGLGWVVVVLLFAVIPVFLAPRVAPALLFRFYHARPVSPRSGPGLYRLLTELSQRAGLSRPPTLYAIPSRMHNAFAVGTAPHAAIGVTDVLLRDFTPREIAGILAHEISHIRYRDTLVMGLADSLSRFAAFLSHLGLFLVLLNLPLILLGAARISWSALLLMLLAPTLASLLQLGLSRTREYAADAGGAQLTGAPEGLASALLKLERIQGGAWERILFPGRRNPEPSLLRTHPPTEERVQRLLELRDDASRMPAQTAPLDTLRRRSQPRYGWGEEPAPTSRPPSWHWFGNWY